jgi:hypothetical protein
MFQFFTAKVGKVIEVTVAEDSGDEKDPVDVEKPIIEKPIIDKPVEKKKIPVAFLELDLAGEQQDSKPAVVSTLVQGVRTNGKSSGQLLPFKDGVTAHLVFDLAFVRRLKPGTLLRVEWETRSGGVMADVLALARLK